MKVAPCGTALHHCDVRPVLDVLGPLLRLPAQHPVGAGDRHDHREGGQRADPHRHLQEGRRQQGRRLPRVHREQLGHLLSSGQDHLGYHVPHDLLGHLVGKLHTNIDIFQLSIFITHDSLILMGKLV